MLDINHQGRLRGNHLTGPRQFRRARAQRREPSLSQLGWTGAFAKGAQAVLVKALLCSATSKSGRQKSQLALIDFPIVKAVVKGVLVHLNAQNSSPFLLGHDRLVLAIVGRKGMVWFGEPRRRMLPPTEQKPRRIKCPL